MNPTNDETANERFAMVIDSLGHTQVSISQLVGVSQGYLSLLMSGQRDITFRLLQKFTKKLPQINIAWVLTGNGEMLNSPGEHIETKVEDPRAVYDKETEPFELLRQWKESFEQRIKALEAEMVRMRDLEAEVNRLKELKG